MAAPELSWEKYLTFTISDRPQYLAETLDTWRKVRGILDWKIRFYIEPSSVVGQQLAIIDSFIRSTGHENCVPWVNAGRLGVLVNPWTALEASFTVGSQFTVLAEEDVTVSSDVLEYFLWGMCEFRMDETVMGVCAFGRQDGDEDQVELKEDFCPLVWGTWPLEWFTDLRDTWDKDYSSGKNGQPSGWDWNINLRVRGDRRFAFPMQSRSQHIGVSGVHMVPDDFLKSQSPSFVESRPSMDYRLVTDV